MDFISATATKNFAYADTILDWLYSKYVDRD